MPEHKALYILEKQAPFVVKSVPTYEPGPGELLIKVESVGLAPCDWAIQALGIIVEKYPVIVGEDIAGTVEEVGNGVTKFKKGDRVYVRYRPGIVGCIMFLSLHAHSCRFRQSTLSPESLGGFQQYAIGIEESTAKVRGAMMEYGQT